MHIYLIWLFYFIKLFFSNLLTLALRFTFDFNFEIFIFIQEINMKTFNNLILISYNHNKTIHIYHAVCIYLVLKLFLIE